MAEFIRYTRSNGGSEEMVYINVTHVRSATFNQTSGDLRIETSAGQIENLGGQQAKDALAILNRFIGKP